MQEVIRDKSYSLPWLKSELKLSGLSNANLKKSQHFNYAITQLEAPKLTQNPEIAKKYRVYTNFFEKFA